jgi:predicted AAA+ superfamily ATPase
MKKIIIDRQGYLEKLVSYKDRDIIKVVTGLRRSGKSTLLGLFRKKLLKNDIDSDQIQSYNFELPENYLNKSWDTLLLFIQQYDNQIFTIHTLVIIIILILI